ncbi:biotin/lipoyl-binding protein [Cupriavidus necator]|uniref:Secretion protein HlyD n=1 Tax=Cupriavidus pinatubonensis (strain JMP 134 / LMG 1197) TaxID=264198 RepID=Q46TT2_CUPPJ|nr:HlyD family secretion protein [Cupriavidus necator]
MNRKLSLFVPVAVTLIAVGAAALTAWHLWQYYTGAPWTRDGRVRAEVVQVAPDVSGLVAQVLVADNAHVKRGQLLFVVDEARFRVALKQAQGAANAARAALVRAGKVDMATAQARLDQADAAVEAASLDLARCRVASPVDGHVADHLPRAGDFVNRGRPALSVVASRSQYVEGYFEETKLPAIRVGAAADVRIMGQSTALRGHVVSIAPGIDDQDRSSGPNLLPTVNPTFNWVRLAQRIPVRVALDEVPPGMHLVAGQTATIRVRSASHD